MLETFLGVRARRALVFEQVADVYCSSSYSQVLNRRILSLFLT